MTLYNYSFTSIIVIFIKNYFQKTINSLMKLLHKLRKI